MRQPKTGIVSERRPVGETDSSRPLLEVEGLTVRYADGTLAAEDVSFVVNRGERVALVGESGSGKSTVALAIAGLLVTPGVEILTRQLAFESAPLDRRQLAVLPRRTPGISMVLQDAMTSLDPVWTIRSQLLAVISARRRVSRRSALAEATQWLHRVGLNDTERILRSYPYELSGGMQQRAMVALALCCEPRLVIADEPTSALDASLARDTMDLLFELTAELRTSLLIVSHDIALTMQYCDRVLVMYRGRIVEQRSTDDLTKNATHPYTRGLLECVPTLETVGLETLPTLDLDSLSLDQPRVPH